MTSLHSAQLAVLAVVCFLGSAAGNLLTSVVRTPQQQPEVVPASALPQTPALSGEVLSEIQALRKELAARASTRTPAEPAGQKPLGEHESIALADRLRDLVSALEHRTAPQAPTVPISEVAKRAPLRGVEFLFQEVADFESEDFDWEAGNRRLTDRHLLWSIREVVDQYGMPEWVSGSGGTLSLSYGLPDPRLSCRFSFADGIVTQVRLDT